jgi:hypothetical protein
MSLTLNTSLITLHVFWTPLCMKISTFRDIAPYGPLKHNRRFGRTCRPRLQGRRICEARNQRESRWQTAQSACRNSELYRKQELIALLATCFHAPFLLGLFFDPAPCFSETSFEFQWTTRCYMPEDRTPHSHGCENLRSYISSTCTDLRTTPSGYRTHTTQWLGLQCGI